LVVVGYQFCTNLHLGVVYTMDHEVVPRPCKNMWLAIELIPWSLRFTPRRKLPQKTYFKAYIIHWHGPTGFTAGETKEVI
jgi:hypothetical protein